MGLYDTIVLESGVSLPEFPADLDPQDLRWQSKALGQPSRRTFTLTADGRLLRRAVTYREKTASEKRREAADHGFDSWDAYRAAVETADLAAKLEQAYPMVIAEQVEDAVWWADHNQHGPFEFHASSPDDSVYDIYWSYEARFTLGRLDELVLLGDRHGASPDELER